MVDPRYPVEVEPSKGERLVYNVRSRSKPSGPPHRVDLLANGGAGECTCVDWQTRRWPAIRDGQPHGTRATLCRHGILARRFFLNALLSAMASEEQQQY